MTANCFAAKDFCGHWAVDKSVDQIPVAATGSMPVDGRRYGQIGALSKTSIKTNSYKLWVIIETFTTAGDYP